MLKDIIGNTDWLEEFAENKCIDDKNEVPKYVIMREKNHNDFCIWEQKQKKSEGCTLTHPVLILENKMKSCPDEEQLKRYETNSNHQNRKISRVLLYMIEPNFNPENWILLPYESYVKKINKHILPNVHDSLSKELINDYCNNFVINLCKLKDRWLGQTEYKFNDDYAKSLRIADLRGKMIYSVMARDLQKSLANDVEIKTNFTNGEGLLDCKISIDSDYKIGVQIQGIQYRRFIECPSSSLTELKKKARSDYSWFFIDQPIQKGKSASYGLITEEKKKQYQKYKGDRSEGEKMFCKYTNSFIYQYRNIKPDATREGVINNIITDMKLITDKLKTNQSVL